MGRKKVLLSWSSGKDSAWAFEVLRRRGDMEVVGIFTTINAVFERVAMHAVRKELLVMQADSIALPLSVIPIPYPCSGEAYEHVMRDFIAKAKNDGVEYMAFGDLFLEDVRQYRCRNLEKTGIEPIFPLWGCSTKALADEMVRNGVKARITCVDPGKIPAEYAGREFDKFFLESLPSGCDPCGENGEFHSFVYDGPFFKKPLRIKTGDIVVRDQFVFADILPGDEIED